MSITVSRWGNSLAVRIPSAVVAKAKLAEGDAVEMSVSRLGKVTITNVAKEPNFGDLYKKITPENSYAQVSTGSAQGGEIVAL